MADSAPEPEQPVRKVTPQAIKTKGEQWTRNYMKKLCNIHLRKRNDAPVDIGGGITYIPKGLDFRGSVLGPDSPFAWAVEVEVKTFRDSFALSALKPHQVERLYSVCQRGELAMLSLVEHDGGKVQRMWWIPWPEEPGERYLVEHIYFEHVPTFSWVAAELRKKALEDARYHAKSIRQVDLPMMDQFLVAKAGRSWELSETHWMRSVLDIPVEQGRLL